MPNTVLSNKYFFLRFSSLLDWYLSWRIWVCQYCLNQTTQTCNSCLDQQTLSFLKKAAPCSSDVISTSYSRCLMSGLLSSCLADTQASSLSQVYTQPFYIFTKSSIYSLDLVICTYNLMYPGGAAECYLIHRSRDQLLGADYWLYQAVDCRR